ncbi:MAG: hypothetical protein ABI543_00905 [Ignavibacteria bacterium]
MKKINSTLSLLCLLFFVYLNFSGFDILKGNDNLVVQLYGPYNSDAQVYAIESPGCNYSYTLSHQPGSNIYTANVQPGYYYQIVAHYDPDPWNTDQYWAQTHPNNPFVNKNQPSELTLTLNYSNYTPHNPCYEDKIEKKR